MVDISNRCSSCEIRCSYELIISFPSEIVFITCQSYCTTLHQWPSGSALKTGRREVPGAIPGRACRPSRSDFLWFFSETRVNTGQDLLERPPQRALPLKAHLPQADNWPQPYNNNNFIPHAVDCTRKRSLNVSVNIRIFLQNFLDPKVAYYFMANALNGISSSSAFFYDLRVVYERSLIRYPS